MYLLISSPDDERSMVWLETSDESVARRFVKNHSTVHTWVIWREAGKLQKEISFQ